MLRAALLCIAPFVFVATVLAQTPDKQQKPSEKPPASQQPRIATPALADVSAQPFFGPNVISGSSTFYPDLFTGMMTATARFTHIPLGVAGMQPSVVMTYRATGASSWLGVGWDLDFGVIERDLRNGVNYDGDNFVYRTSGAVSELVKMPDNTYRAKIESTFIRVRKVSAADGRPSWELTDKNGKRYLFGQTDSSRLSDPAAPDHIVAWYLERIEDNSSNGVDITYIKDQAQPYVARIAYTSTPTDPAQVSIDFFLQDRTDTSKSYAAGFPVTTGKLLKSILIKAHNSPILAYTFHYTVSANTGRSLLDTVQEFGRDVTLDPTGTVISGSGQTQHFGWFSDPTSFDSPITSVNLDWGYPEGRAWVDFDGDGRADYCRTVGTVNHSDSKVWCRLSTGNGFGEEVKSPVIDWGYPEGRAWVDFDGDGRTDYCRVVGGENHRTSYVRCLLSAGNAFGQEVTSSVIDWGYPESRYWVDVNRDGRADFCRFVGNHDRPAMSCLPSTGDGFGTDVTSGAIDPGYPDSRTWADVQGSGRPAFCRNIGTQNNVNSSVSCLPVTDSGTFGTEITSGLADWGYAEGRGWVDFNGDGKADFCRVVGLQNHVTSYVKCLLSTGTGFGEEIQSGVIDWGYPDTRFWVDVNGDGRADFCRLVGNAPNLSIACLLSRGNSFGPDIVISNVDQGYPQGREWADFTGSGKLAYCRLVGLAGNQQYCK